MASSYGEDASKSALQQSYQLLIPRMSLALKYKRELEIARHFVTCSAYTHAKLIVTYIPRADEVDPRFIVQKAQQDGKQVLQLEFVAAEASVHLLDMQSGQRLSHNEFASRGASELLCLVPGLVFDAWGYRIAYGAGYYDNFLAHVKGTKVGLCFGMGMSGSSLPHDSHDVAMDMVVSESAIWMSRS